MVDVLTEEQARAEGLRVEEMQQDLAFTAVDYAVRKISSFNDLEDLLWSCAFHGYVPTLRPDRVTSDQPDGWREAVVMVRRALTAGDYEVYPPAGEYAEDCVE